MLIQISGHLGQDPETRMTPKGQKVTTLRVATNVRRGKNEKTIWWRVTIWGDTFERLMPYLKKGSAVYIMGEMDIPEMYQDREGNTQVSMGMTASYIGFNPFGGGKDKAGDSDAYGAESQEPAMSVRGGAKPANPASMQFEDDIPF
jgi:single-strand DNA-binding protein